MMRRFLALSLVAAGLVLGGGAGCTRYAGTTTPIEPSTIQEGDGWQRVPQMMLVKQATEVDCGVAAVAMVLGRWTRPTGLAEVRASAPAIGNGLRAAQLRDLLRARGLRSFVIAGTLADLEHEIAAGRPVVVGTGKRMSNDRARSHFEVVVALHPARKLVVTLDPSLGWRQASYEGFESEWKLSGRTAIVTLPPNEWKTASR